MSIEAMALVKSRAFGSCPRKAVALVLADYANARWQCWVTQARLAFEAELGERTVRRILNEMEASGLIVREHRRDRTGYRISDLIELVPAAIAELAGRAQWEAGQPRSVEKELPVSVAGSDTDDDRLPATHDSPTGHSRQSYRPELGRAVTVVNGIEPLAEPTSSVGGREDAAHPDRSRTRAQPRARDELFDALTEAVGWNPAALTSTERGRLNRARKELSDVDAAPGDVAAAAREFRRRWPDKPVTPQSLTKSWQLLTGAATRARAATGPPLCPDCGQALGRAHTPAGCALDIAVTGGAAEMGAG